MRTRIGSANIENHLAGRLDEPVVESVDASLLNGAACYVVGGGLARRFAAAMMVGRGQ